MKRKVTIIVGILALLIGINMQVNALIPAEGMFNPIKQQSTKGGTQLQQPWVHIIRKTTLHIGDNTWKPEDNFIKAEDENGNAVGFDRIEVRGSVDTSRAGVYTVVYALRTPVGEHGAYAYITVVGDDLTSIKVKDSTLFVGDKWRPVDNCLSATDADGKPVYFNEVKVEGSVDTTTAGVYQVKYSILNRDKKEVSQVATITVKNDESSIKAKDSHLIAGDSWEPKDSFISATDKAGEPVSLDKIIVNSDTVNTDVSGIYGVRYFLPRDVSGSDRDKYVDVMVWVDQDQSSLEVKDSTIYLGEKWQSSDNVVKATDKRGNPLGSASITVEGSVDTAKVGSYKVKYTILNNKKEKITKEATITVKSTLSKITVKDSTLYIGDKWKPEDNFVSATDKDGNPISFDEIDVSGSVDTNKVGVYKVGYSARGSNYEYATITVKEQIDLTSLEVKDSELYTGSKWSAKDNLVKATDAQGKDIDIKDIKVEGEVNTDKAGIYKVKYTILNLKQEKISKEATITVKDSLGTLKVKDSKLYVGDEWKAEDNFISATDHNGNPISFDKIVVDGAVNTNKAGVYGVRYGADYGNVWHYEYANITVKTDQTSLHVENYFIFVGDKWDPETSLVLATNADGERVHVGADGVKVFGTVNNQVPGSYPITYGILNHKGEMISKTVEVGVMTDKAILELKDSTLYVGDQWKAEDNFVKAQDAYGRDIDFKDVKVEGSVDTTKVGTYNVKYSIKRDNSWREMTRTATIKVKADQTNLEVENSTLFFGDTWNPADNIVKAVDQDGKALDIKDITVDGSVDVKTEGTYSVKYTILNRAKEKITKEAIITVKATDLTSIEVKNSTLYVGDKWNPADNFVKATDAEGNELGVKDVIFDGEVDTTKAGTYKVTYLLLNHKQEKISKEATITVKADQTSLEVKNSTLFFGDTWNPADNIVKAVDQDGKAIDIKDITVEGNVDTNNEGAYKVKYTILNHVKEKITKEATITVKVTDITSIKVKDSELYVGDKWQAEDNFVKATDAEGNAVGIKDVSVEGQVDTTKPGTYKVTYTILNHKQEKISDIATIKVKADQTSLEVKDSTLFFGDTWNPADNIVKAIDQDGKAIDIKDITVEGIVDTNVEGTYPVKYTILNHVKEKITREAKISVKVDDLTSIEVKNSELYVGDKWNQEDNFVKATDAEGKTVGIKDVTVEGKVDTTKAGSYKVTYTILNHKQEKISKTATITVKADQTTLQVEDSTLFFGDTWKPEDNIVKAVDQDGKTIDIKNITVEGNVDVNQEGIYKVKYTILNHIKEKITKEATIIVKEFDLTSIEVKNSELYVGDKWNPADNFVKATDAEGNELGVKDVIFDGEVNTNKAGTYKVTYLLLNHKQEKISDIATVTVKADQTSLEVKDSTVFFGDTWNPADNIVKAIDQDGKKIDIKDITVEGNVDTSKEGINKVTYTVLNHKQEKISKAATITVKADDLTSIKVKNSDLYVGDKWNAEDNLVSAIDAEGNAVGIKDVTVEGKVDTTKAGSYKVTYTILNHKQEKISEVATITVKADQTTLEVKDSSVFFGDTWNPEDNIVKAIDQDGKAIDIKDIVVDGFVDVNTEGVYKVKYTILNHVKEAITKEAIVTVKAIDLTSIEVKDSKLYVGDKWNAEDNFVKATDKDGKAVDLKDVTVEGKVDTSKADTYKVTYTILNHLGEKISKIATITVKADQTTLQVEDSTLFFGDTWSPEDNIVKAVDQDGKKIDIEDIIVEGSVDVSNEGTYQVSYTIFNHVKEKITKQATIIVKEFDLTSIEVKNSELYVGDKWNPADNFVKATDAQGNALTVKDVIFDGEVNTDKAGTYKVTYLILNHKQEKISDVATITVKADQTSLEVKNSTVFFGDTWNPEDNFVKATDQDGKPVAFEEVIVEGTVDTNVEGPNQVTYTIFNHLKEKVTKEATITVKAVDVTSIEVKNSELYVGDKWNAADNLVSAINAEGEKVGIKDVIVEGKVDTTKAGTYEVTYTILNHKQEKISDIATITVKADQTSLEVKNSTLFFGDIWNPEDNIVKAVDQDGQNLGMADITVEGIVDTNVEGKYQVSYTILNHVKEKITKKATITVRVTDVTSIEVKNSALYVGDKWNAEDNLVKATNAEGEQVGIKDVIVEGDVDTSKAGKYEVTFTILNHKQEKISDVATITVKKDQTNIKVKNSKVYISDKWNAKDNIVKAIDADGHDVDIKDIKVEGKVDTTQVGSYKVRYTIFNHKKEKVSAVAKIKVREDQSSLIVKDSELYRDDKWNPADNIIEALDQDGNVIEDVIVIAPQKGHLKAKSNKAVIVEGNVDTSNEGISNITYTILDHANTKITKEVAVNIKLDKTSLQVRDTLIRLNSKWNPADNLVSAVDQDGKVLNIKDVTVQGKVNTRKAGKYKVTYTLMNHANQKISKKATVTVQKKGSGNGNGNGSDKDGNGNLPKTGYDMSFIGSLLGLAGVLGLGSLYLNRRERKE